MTALGFEMTFHRRHAHHGGSVERDQTSFHLALVGYVRLAPFRGQMPRIAEKGER
jgi:hypothetical protein